MPPYEMVSQTAVGRDAHAVERSGTSTLGVHAAAQRIFSLSLRADVGIGPYEVLSFPFAIGGL